MNKKNLHILSNFYVNWNNSCWLFGFLCSSTNTNTPTPAYTMDIDAYKTFTIAQKDDFEWGTGGSANPIFIYEYLKSDTQLMLQSSTLNVKPAWFGFTGELTSFDSVENMAITIDTKEDFSSPNGFGLHSLPIQNFYLRITNDDMYTENEFYSWANDTTTTREKMFSKTEGIKIYLEINSEKTKITDPNINFFEEFSNTEKIQELVIRDMATTKLTNISTWNRKFKLNDESKIFLV